ncbi:MAG: alginate export family protein [Cyanobacteria bacterium]|nr:alginate export family protein [Cyanobacteriota bacterium]
MCPIAAGAQPAVTGTLSNVTRVESWSYFQPKIDPLALTQAPLGDPDYWFIGDRAELGVRVDGSRFDLSGAFNYVRLENLPTRAIGPGGLGSGAFYFGAAGVRYSYQLYLGELTVRMKSATGTSVTIGRMPFSSGGEVRSGSLSLQRLKAERLESRLIGNFEWSYYQRRFDGARVDVDRPHWHFNAAAFVPTQGGYEESTNLSMPRIQVAASSFALKSSNVEWQGFGYFYRDRRRGTAVVDNTVSFDRPANVTIGTVGGAYARILPRRSGEFDLVAWLAAQTGDWYGRPHRAASAALEAGHRWTRVSYRPWLRAGYLWASGDRNAADGRHGTFFQMLPSSRKYGLSSAYAQMNLSDAFAQLAIEPRRLRARIEVHALQLASGADLWYQGSGATASQDRFFGFSGRAARGERSLGTVLEGTLEVPVRKHWSINGYAGTMTAGRVVRNVFTDKHLVFWSVENVVRF